MLFFFFRLFQIVQFDSLSKACPKNDSVFSSESSSFGFGYIHWHCNSSGFLFKRWHLLGHFHHSSHHCSICCTIFHSYFWFQQKKISIRLVKSNLALSFVSSNQVNSIQYKGALSKGQFFFSWQPENWLLKGY